MERLLRDCTCHQTEVPSWISRQLRSGSPLPGGFDLDDVGAELAERLAGEGTGDELAHLDDAQALQGAGCR
jgi:hypothetical protein